MKKILCALIAVAIMVTMVCPVMAATDITVTKAQASAFLDKLEEHMPDDPEKRVLIWGNVKALLLDGTNGIEQIISALNGDYDLAEVEPEINNAIDSIAEDGTKDAAIFALNVYKSIPVADRSDSIALFESRAGFEDLTVEQAAAVDTLYTKYITNRLGASDIIDEHNLEAKDLLAFLTAFKGKFKMTDGEEGEFVLAEFDEDFASEAATDIDETSVNGVTITDDTKSVDIIKAVVAAFNLFDGTGDRENIKTILAHEDIDLYEEGLDEYVPEEDEEEGSSGGIIGGNNGYTQPTTSQQPSEPVEPSKPVIDDTTFEIAEPEVSEDAPTFNDTEEHWSEAYVSNMAARGVVLGDENGNFRSDDGVTRQEIAVMLVRGLGLEEEAEKLAGKGTGFKDDADIADWAEGAINLLVKLGIYTGYEDGEFKPNQIILRQEIVTVVMSYADNTKTGLISTFIDAEDIHGYAEDFVVHATQIGIINGYPDGTFAPLKGITRAEAVKVLYGAFAYYDFLAANR